MKKVNRKIKGFTLIELLIVIILIGILASIIIPKYIHLKELAEIDVTKANLHAIRVAAKLFFAKNNNRWPSSISEMVDSGYLHVRPKEMFTPSTNESTTLNGLGGWVYKDNGETEEPTIMVNLFGIDANGDSFSSY
ncbi:MAG TPA: prepilin-type N-terminal cleavage/methylation domain-containing protein [bacterium]|nr:prepilin-type N-terminal cleavage/methylation domain-containing protein [bacterium]HOL48076.1 prepilin-type N-terminal cleavage/methylation domain-containing protein [bacterium]HPQ19097.1 prepilin-type N-terminal cleavage/methylation domain-containing protein [bacterium]